MKLSMDTRAAIRHAAVVASYDVTDACYPDGGTGVDRTKFRLGVERELVDKLTGTVAALAEEGKLKR